MKDKDWKIPYARPLIPDVLIDAGFTPLLSIVMALRGVTTAEAANALIYGGEECMLDPMLIMGMDKARERILKAIAQGETVAVYGDYDVDGITSTCLLTDYLRWKGLKCLPYIPDRSGEGYGLNCGALDTLKAQGASMLVTVDCGITAVTEAEYARKLGIDMVITDHHECGTDALPDVDALIDCKQVGDTYPNKDLAGVGMALKLICACEGSCHEMLERYADLVAIGTVADVMPLVGENRFLVRLGLQQICKSPRPGIAAMLRESAMDAKRISASTIGFSLAPRLNAAGRLGQASTAAKLLLSRDAKEAADLAAELCALNRQRQSIETDIWHEASNAIAGTAPDAPIVLASESWHQGVIGIAASRLAEQYSLPAIMICLNGEVGKGSCRSYGGFNLYEALSACSKHLIGFGGHALAAGLNIQRDKIDGFRAAIAEYYRINRPGHIPEVQCDLLINRPELLSVDNVKSLDLLEPYGNRNLKPVMCMSGVVLESISSIGGGKHLRMRVRLKGIRFECVFFSHGMEDVDIREGELVDLAFSPQINDYRGSVTVQLVASAIRPHDPLPICDAILNGDQASLWSAVGYRPHRQDFVTLWRSMGADFSVAPSTSEVINQCARSMEPEKYCICLMALLESGLLKSRDGSIFSAECSVISGKADLEATPVIQTLKMLEQG